MSDKTQEYQPIGMSDMLTEGTSTWKITFFFFLTLYLPFTKKSKYDCISCTSYEYISRRFHTSTRIVEGQGNPNVTLSRKPSHPL